MNGSSSGSPLDPAEALATLPIALLRPAIEVASVYLVGGSVRDLLLGRARSDIDLAVDGDLDAVAHALGGEARRHEQFETATVVVDGLTVDLARTREESYQRPGALPQVRPAPIEHDLARRDFTINAMAMPLGEPGALLDPHGGRRDLEAGLLRILHERSFADDPTRALRAARYAARLGFDLEPETERLLARADLETVSTDRVDAEALRLCGEERPIAALERARDWGLLEIEDAGLELASGVAELAAGEPWAHLVDRAVAIHAAALGHVPVGRRDVLTTARVLAAAPVERPSQAAEAARGHDEVELLLARALGAEWTDRYVAEWQHVRLAIGGEELLAAGVPQGPAIGRGLAAALRAKLDGEIAGREQELEVALGAARGT